jgi:hypothetical protein
MVLEPRWGLVSGLVLEMALVLYLELQLEMELTAVPLGSELLVPELALELETKLESESESVFVLDLGSGLVGTERSPRSLDLIEDDRISLRHIRDPKTGLGWNVMGFAMSLQSSDHCHYQQQLPQWLLHRPHSRSWSRSNILRAGSERFYLPNSPVRVENRHGMGMILQD